jgi:DNA polymerase IV (DinB-like DNA polymerase)
LTRIIGHIDLDYFYAQVEEVENPSIKGRPVVVCVFSGRTEDSGVVSTSNYKAREFGVKSGMPITVAKRKLEDKDPVIVRMELPKYESVSDRVMEIVKSQVDVLEQAGIDEAFFDLTDSCKGDYESAAETARRVKDSIMRQERLTCSIGLGRSKVVAKLGSDSAKPAGLAVIPPEATESFLGRLEVTKLYGVGPKTAAALEGLGIRTVAQLARADVSGLEDAFGRRLGIYLHNAANGTDDDPVKQSQAPAQFSRIITLKNDTTDPEEVIEQLTSARADLDSKLANQKTSFRTISAIVILTDLSTKTRSKTFETPMKSLFGAGDTLLDLFSQLSESTDREFRRVGIRLSDLSTNENQSSLAEFLKSP